MGVGKNIRVIRNILGLSQKEFGELLGLSRGMMDSYERGVAEPPFATTKKISDYVGIKIDDLNSLNPKEIEHLYTTGQIENPAKISTAVLAAEIKSLKAIIIQKDMIIEQLQNALNTLVKK